MKPEEYAWNEHERQLYINHKTTIPSPYKIKIIDDPDQRYELEQSLQKLTQKELVIWASRSAEKFIPYIDIRDEKAKSEILLKTSNCLQKRINQEINTFELRNAGFLANTLAKQSLHEVSKFSSRVYAQSIATGHMRGHAIVSADYAIKVINLLYLNNMMEVRTERNRQIALAKSV